MRIYLILYLVIDVRFYEIRESVHQRVVEGGEPGLFSEEFGGGEEDIDIVVINLSVRFSSHTHGLFV